jgi:hypothetical protein
MRILATLFFSFAVLSQQAAMASPAADSLGACLKDSTSGKDRKELARWIVVSISTHPEIRSFISINEETRTDANQRMASLITRLLTENCTAQARSAIAEGGQGFLDAFKPLGEVAMMELMSDRDVAAAVGAFNQFVDVKKLEAVLAK